MDHNDFREKLEKKLDDKNIIEAYANIFYEIHKNGASGIYLISEDNNVVFIFENRGKDASGKQWWNGPEIYTFVVRSDYSYPTIDLQRTESFDSKNFYKECDMSCNYKVTESEDGINHVKLLSDNTVDNDCDNHQFCIDMLKYFASIL